jgi:predicted NAD/FAD-dependent oxidoreductase
LGALPRHVESLAKPEWEGALLFAGDAVIEDFEGGVHAALFSGMEAARRVNEYLTNRLNL